MPTKSIALMGRDTSLFQCSRFFCAYPPGTQRRSSIFQSFGSGVKRTLGWWVVDRRRRPVSSSEATLSVQHRVVFLRCSTDAPAWEDKISLFFYRRPFLTSFGRLFGAAEGPLSPFWFDIFPLFSAPVPPSIERGPPPLISAHRPARKFAYSLSPCHVLRPFSRAF